MDINELLAPTTIPAWEPDKNLETPFREVYIPYTTQTQVAQKVVPYAAPAVQAALELSEPLVSTSPDTLDLAKITVPEESYALITLGLIQLKTLHEELKTAQSAVTSPNNLNSYRSLLSKALKDSTLRLVKIIEKRAKSAPKHANLSTQDLALLSLTYRDITQSLVTWGLPPISPVAVLIASQTEDAARAAIEAYKNRIAKGNITTELEKDLEAGVRFAVSESRLQLKELANRALKINYDFNKNLSLIERGIDIGSCF